MTLWIIGILALLVIVASCLPVTKNFRYITKLGYWNILIILVFYILFDIWFLTQISMVNGKVWVIFILINISGITAIFRTYEEIRNNSKKK